MKIIKSSISNTIVAYISLSGVVVLVQERGHFIAGKISLGAFAGHGNGKGLGPARA